MIHVWLSYSPPEHHPHKVFKSTAVPPKDVWRKVFLVSSKSESETEKTGFGGSLKPPQRSRAGSHNDSCKSSQHGDLKKTWRACCASVCVDVLTNHRGKTIMPWRPNKQQVFTPPPPFNHTSTSRLPWITDNSDCLNRSSPRSPKNTRMDITMIMPLC